MNQRAIASEEYVKEFAFAHDVAHGFASLAEAIRELADVFAKERQALNDEDWAIGRSRFGLIGREIEAQRYELLNFLQYRWPSLVIGLERPMIEVVSPNELLNDMLPHYQQRAEAYDIAMTFDLRQSQAIPPIAIDLGSVRRAFHNVLTNAIKYSYKGMQDTNRFVLIRTHLYDPQRQSWAVSVQNYGVGILEDERSEITKPGVRGKLAIADNTVGAGLGLAQVEQCMRAHGGMLRIKSKLLHDQTYLTTVSLVWPSHTSVRRSVANVGAVD